MVRDNMIMRKSKNKALREMTVDEIALAQHAEDEIAQLPQLDIETFHILHGGQYTRTIRMVAGQVLVGALVKIPTTLVIEGDCKVYIGDDIACIKGVRIIPAAANRKQVFYANTSTSITMSFPTQAKTIEEAEIEFTDDAPRLMSRLDTAINHIIIT